MNEDIELAKKLLESKGYTVSKKMNESEDNGDPVYNALNELGISFDDITVEDNVWYVSKDDEPFRHSDLKKVWDKIPQVESAGFSDLWTMWFAFADEE